MDEADRTLRRLRRIAPKMLSHEVKFTLAELALLNICLDTVARQVAQRVEWEARHVKRVAPRRQRMQKLA